MSDDVSRPETSLAVVRPTVLPSLAQFGIERDLAIRLAHARGFLPDHYLTGDGTERAAKVLAAIEYGRAVGIEPMIALQNITMIKGKAGASALLIGAQLRRAGYEIGTAWFDQQGAPVEKKSPNVWGCEITLTKGGKKTGDGSFSLTDAQRAGLVKEDSGWARYPKDMLYARALTQAAREGAQDAVLGMAYTADELGVEVDYDGNVDVVRLGGGMADPLDGKVLEGEVVTAPGVPEATAGTQLPTAAAIQPTPPAPSQGAPAAEVARAEATPPAAEVPQAPPVSVSVAPLSGPALSRRMGAGRSIGPAPRRTNTVTVDPEAPTAPATAPEAPPQAVASAEAVPSQPAPPGLTDEPVAAAPVDDGLGPQRELLRQSAADLARINAILRNKMEHALKNEPLEPVPPKEPTAVSDEGLARLIDRDYPGRTLANLDGEAIQNRLELVESNLAKKKSLMLERGITEE